MPRAADGRYQLKRARPPGGSDLPGREPAPFGGKEFKQVERERIPSLRMELGEYDHRAVEAASRELWEAHDVYRYDRDGLKGKGAVFSVDTPPPYVSAAHLH